MIKDKKILAIIPARSGSKRIFNKNIKNLLDKPLIAYTINEAKKSKYIDRIITSTDSNKIAKVARKFGSEVPFLRPKNISGDSISDFVVFKHALNWLLSNEQYKYDIIVQLRPTSPLRVVEEIDKAIELLLVHPEADSVRTVTRPEQSPYKMYKINKNGYMEPLLRIGGIVESFNLPEQKLPKAYKHVGYVDVMWYKTIMNKKQMAGKKIIPFILEKAYSGVNTEEDWNYYEYLIQSKKKSKKV